ncbi:MAG: heavy-metal-associated domain-containing protein [Candidatus Rokubacteria bacterium]|nr:heavy-metal-associated domain-containing protein [Candidatus Rokubacteria bacterium]
MSKSLGRLDAVRAAKADLKTQTATVTFKPGKPIDFRALADAVDKAGFKAGSITIWATGTLSVGPDGRVTLTVSGTNQTMPVADSPRLAQLKGEAGKEISIVAEVQFEDTRPRLVIGQEPAKGAMEGMPGTKGQ